MSVYWLVCGAVCLLSADCVIVCRLFSVVSMTLLVVLMMGLILRGG